MTDIVERLREWAEIHSFSKPVRDAADEIERLRAEVDRLRAGGCARDQRLTQYCAEAEALKHDIVQYIQRDTERLAEVEALRAALRVAEAEMTCRNGNSHYCPNCDRSLYRALHDVRAALAAPKEEA